MLVKFDHITYVAGRRNKEKELLTWQENGWKIKFFEDNLINVSTKKNFMGNWQKTHDLYFLEKKEEINTELIFYDKVSEGLSLEVKRNYIYAKSKDIEKTKIIVEKIGGKISPESDGFKTLICNMKGCLDKEECWLVFNKATDLDNIIYLDTKGYGCITLLVDSNEKLCKEVGNLGIFLQEEELVVNNQKLGVAFFRDLNANIIYEFITIRR